MKAIFSSTRKIDFTPMDNNESILLGNLKDIANNRFNLDVEESAGKQKYSLSVKEPSKLIVGDDLMEAVISMEFPTSISDAERASINTHDIIVTRGGMKITCIKDAETNLITVKAVFSVSDELVLYSYTADKVLLTNFSLIKLMKKDIDMTITEVNKDSFFYNSFTI